MRIRELYQEGAIVRTLLTNRILDFYALYSLSKPFRAALSNTSDIETQYQQKKISLDQRDKMIEHELSQFAAQLAATLVGSSLLKNVGTGLINVFGYNLVFKEIADLALAIGQGAFMNWINSEQGRQIIAKWLTGQTFVKLGFITDSGPLFDKFIGAGLKQDIDAAKISLTGADNLIRKGAEKLGIPLNKQDPQASKEIGQTSTPASPNVGKTIPVKPGVEKIYDPGRPADDPYRVNIKRGAF